MREGQGRAERDAGRRWREEGGMREVSFEENPRYFLIFFNTCTGHSKVKVGPLSDHTKTSIHFSELLTKVWQGWSWREVGGASGGMREERGRSREIGGWGRVKEKWSGGRLRRAEGSGRRMEVGGRREVGGR
jgi:hypothetical protein